MKNVLEKVKEIYQKNENIIQYLKNLEGRKDNSVEDIMISYDFQAGSYIDFYEQTRGNVIHEKRYEEMARIMEKYFHEDEKYSLLDAGIGEGTTLFAITKGLLEKKVNKIIGLDISWTRLKYAEAFLKEKGIAADMVIGDLANLPLENNSIDIVYTCHAIEPNTGKERIILEELYRVANKYIILFEPLYEFANQEAKERMKKNGYIMNLVQTAEDLQYNVIECGLLENQVSNCNPTGVIVIQKNDCSQKTENVFQCPITKKRLFEDTEKNVLVGEGMLMYPKVSNVYCLTEDNAIVSTQYDRFFNFTK